MGQRDLGCRRGPTRSSGTGFLLTGTGSISLFNVKVSIPSRGD